MTAHNLPDILEVWNFQPPRQSAYKGLEAVAAIPSIGCELRLAWCLDVARQRVENIVSNQRRGSYGKAATLTVACTEALRLHGNVSGGNAVLETIRTRFPRHSAFQAELRSAIALMERSKLT